MTTAEHVSFDPAESLEGDLSGAASFNFLAPERKQKFDLLRHLLANLPQPLLLIGPDGIGKSTFLSQLVRLVSQGWQVCPLQGSPDLSFEQVQHALARFLGADSKSMSGTDEGLRRRLDNLAKDERTVVLALDDAGTLIPGVFDALCRYVQSHEALRLVATLRPDDLHIKASTDPWGVEQSHVIELPPLTPTQCSEYLRSLWKSSKRTAELLTEDFAVLVYRLSHGIPGRIEPAAQKLAGKPPLSWNRAMAKPIYLALAAVVLVVIALTWWQQSSVPPQTGAMPKAEAETPVAEPGQTPAITTEPQLSDQEPAIILPEIESLSASIGQPQAKVEHERKDSTAEGQPRDSESNGPIVLDQTDAPQGSGPLAESDATPPADPKPEAQPRPAEPAPASEERMETILANLGVRDSAWLLRQNPGHYTLQIAAFDKQSDLLAFARRYQGLQSLAYYQKKRLGQDWYSLLYGIFPSKSQAQQAMKQLPPALGDPWLRRLGTIQKQIRAN